MTTRSKASPPLQGGPTPALVDHPVGLCLLAIHRTARGENTKGGARRGGAALCYVSAGV